MRESVYIRSMLLGKYIWRQLLLVGILIMVSEQTMAQESHSVARQWNEVLLEAIRNDFARPTVHARNLFHVSIAMYDCWAAYDNSASTFLLDRYVDGFFTPFSKNDLQEVLDLESARNEAISYATYRLLVHRFGIIGNSPGREKNLLSFDSLMRLHDHDINFESIDYLNGPPASLGNYVAHKIIEFGQQDGSNEQNDYRNLFYEPVNYPLRPEIRGTLDLEDPNRWQPIEFVNFFDQGGNSGERIPEFLGAEWGAVTPFALSTEDLTIYERGGNEYWVYHDPGDPFYLTEDDSLSSNHYKWGNGLVAIWSSHLDPSDGVLWDISPANIGNIDSYPTTPEGIMDFYNFIDGGDASIGHSVNPITNTPYEPQTVPRGDYTRVLAEFWADGPDSETPPGHWFTFLNYVSDHPDLIKKLNGQGEVLDDLEWDVKAYFTLGGAMHDAAVTAWGIKGWYDYIRPISALRYLAELGQSTSDTLPSYSDLGISLVPNYIELVDEDDPLKGEFNENVGKIKIWAWNGTRLIEDPTTDVSGVGWILTEDWVPYQRPTFVTPPFAGYVSGHSTFSRAAAEVLTLLTGSEYFPGGLGEFKAPKDNFLVFERGPSQDVTLQWATYRDASDQTSLSRIWGGIHPPVDDIPGRIIGIEVGNDSFREAIRFFNGEVITQIHPSEKMWSVFPNPSSGKIFIDFHRPTSQKSTLKVFSATGKVMMTKKISAASHSKLSLQLPGGLYILRLITGQEISTTKVIITEPN